MSYSTQLDYGNNKQAQARQRLDVRQFGGGYWIGAIGSSLAALLFWVIAVRSALPKAPMSEAFRFFIRLDAKFIVYGGFAVMALGAILSFRHFRQAWRSQERDRNALIGGGLGFLLCGWPFVAGFVIVIRVLMGLP